MTYNAEILANNNDIQALIDKAKNLPTTVEDLTTELYEQDGIIAEIMTALEGKMGGSGEADSTIVNEQADLIEQIKTVLQGKAAGGSGWTETVSGTALIITTGVN